VPKESPTTGWRAATEQSKASAGTAADKQARATWTFIFLSLQLAIIRARRLFYTGACAPAFKAG